MEMMLLVLVVGVISYYVTLGRAREKAARKPAEQAPAKPADAVGYPFCPTCFRDLAPGETVCSACGTDVRAWTRETPVDARLIQNLQHPDAGVRLAAVVSLGDRQAPDAAQPLVESALAHPDDIMQGLETAVALARLPLGDPRTAGLTRLQEHPAEAVRAAAQALVEKEAPVRRRFYFMD